MCVCVRFKGSYYVVTFIVPLVGLSVPWNYTVSHVDFIHLARVPQINDNDDDDDTYSDLIIAH